METRFQLIRLLMPVFANAFYFDKFIYFLFLCFSGKYKDGSLFNLFFSSLGE